MRKLLFVPCVFAIASSVFVSCSSADKTTEAKPSSPQTNTAQAAALPSEAKQYRAVCIEKDQHGGNEYVLSKWFDSPEKADELGKYHGDFKYKGHRWRIDERVKPAAEQH